MMKSLLRSAIALAATCAATAVSAAEVNVYSYRQEFLIRPMLDAFTAETGIDVNVVFAKEGMLERLRAEGDNSPADIILTVDISRLDELAKAGLLQPVNDPVLEGQVPANFRHPEGLWFGLTTRARVIYASKDRVNDGDIKSYEELADERWRGRICIRSGKHVYNLGLLASMIAAHGEEAAQQWATGLKANLARSPQGNDRAQVQAIKEGLCDLALGNNYYYGKMKFNEEKPEQKEWAEAVNVVFPNQGDRGTHVNISGIAMTKSSKNKEAAQALMVFLSGNDAQQQYAEVNFEYPVNPAVSWSDEVVSWGKFEADKLSLEEIAQLSPKALLMVNELGLE